MPASPRHVVMHSNDIHKSDDEAGVILLRRLATDLYDWVDSAWVVAMRPCGGTIEVLSIVGVRPDVQACLEHARTALAQGERSVSAGIDIRLIDSGRPPHRPSVVLPIRCEGVGCDIVVLGMKKSGDAYTPADFQLMMEGAAHTGSLLHTGALASRIAVNLAATQRISLELESARRVQNRFFPYLLPPVHGLEYYGDCRPAEDIGGDFFDFERADASDLVVSVGDVSGKGIPAAIMMTGLQASLRTLRGARHKDAAKVVRELNRIMCEVSPDNVFATMFYGHIDTGLRQIRYVNAGHEAALLIGQSPDRIFRLESTGTVLGLSDRTVYEQRAVAIRTGDVLVVFTDGISEAVDAEGGEFCDSRLVQLVREYPDASASDLVGRIMSAVERFTTHSTKNDDRTVVVVRFAGFDTECNSEEVTEALSLAAAV